eukprot:SAG11_NODE_2012_length_3924_cov_1.906667_6_plen_57_part_00
MGHAAVTRTHITRVFSGGGVLAMPSACAMNGVSVFGRNKCTTATLKSAEICTYSAK